MAATAIASKAGVVSNLTKGALGTSKMLAVASMNKVQSASIYSKTSGNLEPRLKPWDYKRWGFDQLLSYFDGTTKRFNYNSKMVVVEGPPALGKTEVAKAIADELDMKFVPGFSMDTYYINSYGYDLRELDYRVEHERVKTYDEKKFAQDPLGQDGGLDRMLYILWQSKYIQYVDNLAHIFNTGEGIVTERSPFSDWIYFEAAYRQGWIDKTTKAHFSRMWEMTHDQILRPNLIIHLDAPTDVIQSKIRERSKTTHPWEANSPVWENTDYVEHLYGQLMKKQYLKTASESSEVLSYDWSEGGDVEVVVEDIERLNMDYHDKYDKQQKDWRLLTEDGFATKRAMYTNKNKLLAQFRDPFWSADKIILSSAEGVEAQKVKLMLPGNYYMYGHNTVLGDPDPFWALGGANIRTTYHDDVKYQVDNVQDDSQLQHEERLRASRKAAGEKDWWKLYQN